MSVSETVFNALHKEKDLLGTQDRVAKKLGKSQGMIQKYLSGIDHVQGMKLETLDFLFPNATINLHGDKNIIQTASNVSVRNGSVNTISMNSCATAEQIRARIIAALIPLKISSDALQTVLQTIHELDLG